MWPPGIGVWLGVAAEVAVLLFKVARRGSKIEWTLLGSFSRCIELCVDPVQFEVGKVPHWSFMNFILRGYIPIEAIFVLLGERMID